MLILDDAAHPPTAFSAGLPEGVQLSQLPDPRNVREAMARPGQTQLLRHQMKPVNWPHGNYARRVHMLKSHSE